MNIPNQKTYTLPFHGRDLKFIVSSLAGQANASVIGQYGGTSVLVTVVMGKEDRPIDFFPLTVDYEERFYAAGKIIGSRYVRREGRPSQEAILSGRLIDRSIRPLFDERLRRDVQVVITVLSYDEENDPDFLALCGASLALSISDIPWGGPIAGVKLVQKGDITVNPAIKVVEQLQETGTCDAFFAGTADVVNMIELGGREITEADAAQLFVTAHEEIKKLIAFQNGIIDEIGKKKADVVFVAIDEAFKKALHARAFDALSETLFVADAQERDKKTSELKELVRAELQQQESYAVGMPQFDGVWEQLCNEVIHRTMLEKNKRPDGRAFDEIRPIHAEVGLFERLHGSSVFMRGETQSLAVTTLAAPGSEQFIETMETTGKRRFMLHYNFPPYATGETGRVGSPGRREIGHGALAEKALRAVIPSKDVFPYTIRVVSEIVSSNGSSSMASVCAGTLSLMDAGVPLTKPVAGIAMGLATPQGYDSSKGVDEFKVFTDLQGLEDHYGDMDFKVAGTRDGITAIQMDVKIKGISFAIYQQGLTMAHEARIKILDVIQQTIPAPRTKLSAYAPKILTYVVKPHQIGLVIGQGGKTINGIIEEFGVESIDIDDDGTVFVSGTDQQKVEDAIEYIKNLTKEFEVGEVITGPIIKLLDFGAIVDLGGGKDGMIHVSEIKNGYVERASDLLKLGQEVTAKVVKVDENGKIGLSIKAMGGK